MINCNYTSGRQRDRDVEKECVDRSIDLIPSNDWYERGDWLSVHCVAASRSTQADCVRRPTTTIYYECHTNTRQRSNFVIESKSLSPANRAGTGSILMSFSLPSDLANRTRRQALPGERQDLTTTITVSQSGGLSVKRPYSPPPRTSSARRQNERSGHINGVRNARTGTTFGQRRWTTVLALNLSWPLCEYTWPSVPRQLVGDVSDANKWNNICLIQKLRTPHTVTS